ncbi:MAG: addiction module protein [Myxococcales bacterium]|nr:addiction module protein [Myxococcales bacterium]
MTEQANDVLITALQLSVSERAELAAELLASLDGEAESDVEAAWTAEIERRARRVLAEGSRGRRWEEVRDDLRRQLR